MRILHLLNWKLKSIEKILPFIKEQGFSAVQINPMQGLKTSKAFDWWLSYQPTNFQIGNCFGSRDDLISLCKKGTFLGIDIYVDVICNHVANKNYEPLIPSHEVDKSITSHPEYFKDRVMLTDCENRYHAVRELIGLPGLNLANEGIQKIILDYLLDLKTCGVKGFRFDAAKHIGLPSDGVSFFKNIKEFLNDEKLYAYGEFLNGDIDWRDEFSQYIDILSFHNDGLSDIDKFVTFVESHDTYLHPDFQNTTYNYNESMIDEYYNLLTFKYDKTIYYARPLKYPYNPNGGNVADFMVPFDKKDEFNYFSDNFLVSKQVKVANTQNKVLIKR